MLGVFPRVFGQRGVGPGDEPTNRALGGGRAKKTRFTSVKTHLLQNTSFFTILGGGAF